MIKLIATDVDGTLVKDGSPEIYPEFIDVIKKLREKDIIVCIASGRQYSSIMKMFGDIKDDLIFIAGNGAHIKCRGVDMHVAEMNRKYVDELVNELRKYEDYGMIAEGPGITYIEKPYKESFLDLLENGYRNNVEIVDDVLDKSHQIVKVSIFNRPSIRELGEGTLIPEWKDRLKVTMAGEDWVDFMDKSVDKGNALKRIQEFFGISSEETMVFGDNNNDIGMLEAAAESYAVENAPDAVKAHAAHVCKSWKEKGVYEILNCLEI
ncbi:MAG: HAD family hydrolase [Pseudobutyrivibrio sp.]|nr:HAD family hydrolase [Pseudobutyrivibrio sp.]